jgi:hypothetical protein
MHTTLLSGLDLVPPKFLGLRRIIILLFASAVKITVSISSTKDRSFSSSENSASEDAAESCHISITVFVVRVVAKPFGPIDLRQHVDMKAF